MDEHRKGSDRGSGKARGEPVPAGGEAGGAPQASIRPARPEEIPALAALFLESLADLQRRNGMPSSLPSHGATAAEYRHILATGLFEVAEVDGKPAALACAVVRKRTWFLSGFWALPEVQRRGLGMPLLRKVRSAGEAAGATTFFTWSSIDRTAMAAYLKIGMLPGTQILVFEGTPSVRPVPVYRDRRLEPGEAGPLDRDLRGAERPEDHAFWRQSGKGGWAVERGGRAAGYYYLGPSGIGPAAWVKPEDAEAVLSLAFRRAQDEGRPAGLGVPGTNHAAIRFALQSGLRLVRFAHLLTSAPFGALERYVPSGPSLF